MRRILYCSLYVFFGIACKTTNKNQSRLKVLQNTPESGIAGVLDKAPLLIEPGKPAVVSLNRLAGTPPADSSLRLARIELSIKPADGYTACKPVLTKAMFTEMIEKDIQAPEDFQTRASYRSQDIGMAITGDAEKGWTLVTDSGHDIGDLYLSFDASAAMTCQVSAVGHGFYAVNSTASWGEGSGDVERDRMVRAWGSDRGHRLWHYLWHGMRSEWQWMEQTDRDALITHFGPTVAPPARNP